MTVAIISREEAKAAGLPRYFTGKPCRNGHIRERRTNSGACLGCSADAAKRWRKADPKRAKVYYKKHRNLETSKAALKAWIEANPERAKTTKAIAIARWQRNNLAKRRIIEKRWAHANRSTLAAKRQRYVAANPEKVREAKRRYYEKNVDVLIAKATIRTRKRKEAHDAEIREWRLKNRNTVATYYFVSRPRTRKSRPKWVDTAALRRFKKECPEGMVVDHIVPIAGETVEGYLISGLHVPWNLQYLTISENSRKGFRMRKEDQALCLQ